jgi:hypothetical protein
MENSLVEISFLIICVAIALVPLAAKSGALSAADGVFFRWLWWAWIIFWGSFAVLTARDYFVFDPVVLRLAALFGGQVAVGVLFFLTVPRLRRAIRAIPLTWLVGWQMARVVGGFFLIGAALGDVSMPFAAIAGLGDIAVGVMAGVTMRRMQAEPARHAQLAIRHMRMGLTDFAVAISTAILTQAVIGWPYVLIPLFLVPMAVLAHLAVWDAVWQAQDRERMPTGAE